jgi:hypothetical protein
MTGESVDISEYLDFGFYDWVWYKENAGTWRNKTGPLAWCLPQSRNTYVVLGIDSGWQGTIKDNGTTCY